MRFDLSTALAVREREDGLLEKDTFDLSSSRPVDDIPEISMDRNASYSLPANKDRAVVELLAREHGENIKIGQRIDWELHSPVGEFASTLPLAGTLYAWQGIRGAIMNRESTIWGSIAKGVLEPEKTPKYTSLIPGVKELPQWAQTILAIGEDVVGTAGVSASVSAAKQAVFAKVLTKRAIAGEAQYVEEAMVNFEKSGVATKSEYVAAAKNTYWAQFNRWSKSIEAELTASESGIGMGEVATGTTPITELYKKSNLISLAIEDLKTIGKVGAIKIPNQVGKTVLWEGQLAKIVEQQGERFGIELVKEPGRIIVAMASTLTKPEFKPQPTEGKVIITKSIGGLEKGESTVLSIDDVEYKDIKNLDKTQYQIEKLDNGSAVITKLSPTGEGQKPPVEPPKTAVGGPEEPKKPIIKNVEISEEAQVKLESSIEDIRSKLEQVKGKPLTHEEVKEAAKTSGLLKDIVTRAESKEAEAELIRTEQHLAALAEEKGISKDFMENLKIVSSFATNAARNLGARRIIAKPEIYTLKTKIINKLNELGKTIEEIETASKDVDFNDQEQVTAFYREFIKPTLGELISEYRYINLLSSPKTHIVNITSNALQVTGLAPATKLVSGLVDPVYKMLMPGYERQHYLKETPAYLQGAFSAIPEASFKALGALLGKTYVQRPDINRIPTGNKILKAFKYIPQALEAADVFFKTIAYQGELESQLVKGVELEKAKEVATKKAAYWVFRKALDPIRKTKGGKFIVPEQGILLGAIDNITSLIYSARKLPLFGKAVSWFTPFVQTPMEIAKQGIEYSPLGSGTIPGAKDKVDQISKSILGSLVAVTTAGIILSQDSTGDEPTGSKEKALFRATGRIPWSIRFGDTWVSVNRLGVIGYPIALALSTKHYLKQNPAAATDTSMQKATKVLGGMGEYFASQSYVESLGDLLDLAKNAPGAPSKLVANFPAQVIPLSSFQRWINNYFIDPIFRKAEKGLSPESIIDNAKKSIVFATKSMEAYTDADDAPSKRNMPLLNAFSPIAFSKANDEYEEEYQEYLEKRREDLIDKKESGDEPKRKTRRRR